MNPCKKTQTANDSCKETGRRHEKTQAISFRAAAATGLVLSLLLTLSYFSPSQQALRNLPDTLHLTAGQLQTLELGSMLTLTTQAGTAAVSASEDETLRAQGAVSLSSETAGTSELLLSLMGLLPLKKVEVEVSPEKRLIPGGMGHRRGAAHLRGAGGGHQ